MKGKWNPTIQAQRVGREGEVEGKKRREKIIEFNNKVLEYWIKFHNPLQ